MNVRATGGKEALSDAFLAELDAAFEGERRLLDELGVTASWRDR